MKKINIEVEGGELLIMSDEQHYAIIPAKHRQEVKDMVEEGCDNCINSYIQTLPKESNYAEDGSLYIDDGDPKTIRQDNTRVNKTMIPIVDQKFTTNPIPKSPILTADTRSDLKKKIDEDYTNAVNNPSTTRQMGEAFGKLGRWAANPIKMVGDIAGSIIPNSPLAELPNTEDDIYEHRKKMLNPYTSDTEKLNESFDEATNLTTNALINVGTLELGFALPKSFVSPTMSNLFKLGSKANFSADLLQLSNIDLDKLEEGDMSEIGNLILNSSSLLSKMDNFDASTIYDNIKNWKTLSKMDKTDTYKDIFNLSQSINQQKQRQ